MVKRKHQLERDKGRGREGRMVCPNIVIMYVHTPYSDLTSLTIFRSLDSEEMSWAGRMGDQGPVVGDKPPWRSFEGM